MCFSCSLRDHVTLKKLGHDALFSLVDAVVCGDDPRIKHGKPAPDIFLAAAAAIGVDPTRCRGSCMFTWRAGVVLYLL